MPDEGLNMGEKDYISYRIERPDVLCQFPYPANWRAREIAEEGSLEVFIAGPRNRAGTYTTYFAVRISPTMEQTPEEAAADLLSRYHVFSGFRELGKTSGLVAGCPSVEIEFTYRMLLPLDSIAPQWTPIRQRHIFLKRGDQLLELCYAAPEEDYPTWLDAFHRLVQGLTLGDSPARTI